MWKWTCPICKKEIEEDFELDYIKNECVGCTHDCPECGGLVLINEDGLCSDFGATLERIANQIEEMEKNGEIVCDPTTGEYIDVKNDQ